MLRRACNGGMLQPPCKPYLSRREKLMQGIPFPLPLDPNATALLLRFWLLWAPRCRRVTRGCVWPRRPENPGRGKSGRYASPPLCRHTGEELEGCPEVVSSDSAGLVEVAGKFLSNTLGV